jgi:hypothetical protein
MLFFSPTVLLSGLSQAQEERILDREALIREIATQYSIRGFDVSPLEQNRVIDFTTKLGSLLAQQTTEVEHIQVQPWCNYSQPDLPLTPRYPRTKFSRAMPHTTNSPGNCTPLWKDTNNNERTTVAGLYVFIMSWNNQVLLAA